MKTKTTPTILSVLILAAHLPFASFAQGTSGGGQATQNADGKLSLMDTVEGLQQSSRCDWSKSMSDLLKESPEAQEALNKLALVHAYAPVALRSEAERIQVCIAGEFNPRFENSLQGDGIVFKRLNRRLKTVAYRWGQKVIIDQTKRAELSPVDVAFLYIHEISHSFLPMNPYQSGGHLVARDSDPVPVAFEGEDETIFSRRDRLWSFVHSIYRIFKNEVNDSSAKSFSQSIVMNGATLPETDAFWKKSPEAYEIALNRNSKTRDRIVAISQIDWRDVVGFGTIKGNLVDADVTEIQTFLNTWYTPAIRILTAKQYGWEEELRAQIETYGLDPLQVLPGDQSLMTIATESQNQSAVNLLATYPAQSNDRGIRVRYFKSILDNRMVINDLESILARFDPNDGEMFIKLENGIQYYSGKIPFFVMAVERGNWVVTQSFLSAGKVNTKTLSQGLRALVEYDMGNSQSEPTTFQTDARIVFNQLVSSKAFTASAPDLVAALNAKNEYAANLLLDSVAPTNAELIEFAKSSWANAFERRALLKKVLSKGITAINTPDRYGYTMIDYAIASQNVVLFDLLAQTGANVFKRTSDQGDRDWTMGRLIENDAGPAITAYLTSYVKGVMYRDALWLNKQRDLAEVRSKPNAQAAIDAIISRK